MFSSLVFLSALLQQAEDVPRSRPNELLQARSCLETARANPNPFPSGDENQLVDLDAVPPCLAPIFGALGADALRLAADGSATVILYVGVGRAFQSTTLLFSTPADPRIHYLADLGPIFEKLSSEWDGYRSPDGELGWSGFILVVDKSKTRVRFLTSSASPFGAYEMAIKLEAEFFPGKTPE